MTDGGRLQGRLGVMASYFCCVLILDEQVGNNWRKKDTGVEVLVNPSSRGNVAWQRSG